MAKRKAIPETTKMQLVARAAGRCQFPGCNKVLYEDELTKRRGNNSNYAHIIPCSEDGPRGPETINERPDDINSLDNLMLLCWDHHKLIDTIPVSNDYSASELRRMKNEHEERIKIATSIQSNHKAFVVNYAVPIAEGITSISQEEARLALFPDYYPAESDIIDLSPELPKRKQDDLWYKLAAEDLQRKYDDFIRRRLTQCTTARLAIFAIGPMPLLIQLGVHINDTGQAIIYQKQRDSGWKWDDDKPERVYTITRPNNPDRGKVVLLITLTQDIDETPINQALGDDVAIWKLSSDYHNYDVIYKRQHLIDFKAKAREALDNILNKYGNEKELHVFPIMPVSACVEFGRLRTAAHNPWIIYERRRDTNGFIKILTIN